MGAGPGTAGLPPGYPQEYEQQVTLRDGRRALIRPILPSDAPELGEAIKTADPDTLHRRFLGAPPRVTPALLAHLTVVNYVRRFALVAIDTVTGRGVAVARYERPTRVWRKSRSRSGPPGGGRGWELSLSCAWPRPRPSAASIPSAPLT